MLEIQGILFKRLIVGVGILFRPSELLDHLDFIDAPNLRIQFLWMNLYLYVDGAKKFIERNRSKDSLAKDFYNRGFLAGQMSLLQKSQMKVGNA